MHTLILLAEDGDLALLQTRIGIVNPFLEIRVFSQLKDLLAVSSSTLHQARLVSFLFEHIVPASVLDHLGCGAYNFHPGPPDYPGWAPISFAIYKDAKRFGVTLHHMAKRVDSGAIVAVEYFDVSAHATLESLGGETFAAALHLFWRMSDDLFCNPNPLPPLGVHWSGTKTTRHDVERLRVSAPNLGAQESERRLKAFAVKQ